MAHHRLRDWANLMPEILSLVARRLSALDYANFSEVCTSWASIATPANGMPPALPLRQPHPFILLRPGKDGDRRELCCTLLDALGDGRLYEMDPPPEMDGKRVVGGSQFGWLPIIHTDSSHIFLFNPFTRSRIDLPPITTPLSDSSLWAPSRLCKVVLSSDPSAGCFMAVALFGYRGIALFRTGEDAWSFWDNYDGVRVDDVFCWEGKAVAVTRRRESYEIELTHSPVTTVVHRYLVYSPPRRVVLFPEVDGIQVSGSQFGWLALTPTTDSSHIFLFNPFTRAQIKLPPIDTASYVSSSSVSARPYSCKVVLSSNPSGGNFMAVAMLDNRILALFRTGEKAWSFWYNRRGMLSIADVICWEGKVVVVSKGGDTCEIELSHSPGASVVDRLIVDAPSCTSSPEQYLLTSLSGDLLRVLTVFSCGIEVEILDKERGRWIPKRCFPGMALLITATCSMSIPASRKTSIKENCVYHACLHLIIDLGSGRPAPWPMHLPRLQETLDIWITSPCFEAN